MPSFRSKGTWRPKAIFDHDAGADAPTTFAAAIASLSTVFAATLVYASSFTFGFSSSGPVTWSMWKLPPEPFCALPAQNSAAPEITGQPFSASHPLSPVAR